MTTGNCISQLGLKVKNLYIFWIKQIRNKNNASYFFAGFGVEEEVEAELEAADLEGH